MINIPNFSQYLMSVINYLSSKFNWQSTFRIREKWIIKYKRTQRKGSAVQKDYPAQVEGERCSSRSTRAPFKWSRATHGKAWASYELTSRFSRDLIEPKFEATSSKINHIFMKTQILINMNHSYHVWRTQNIWYTNSKHFCGFSAAIK